MAAVRLLGARRARLVWRLEPDPAPMTWVAAPPRIPCPEPPRSSPSATARGGLGSLAAAPVLTAGPAAGSLVLAAPTGRRFTEPEMALLSSLAEQMALVLENARLEAALTRQRRESEDLARVAGVVGEKLGVTAAGQRIADSVLGLLGVHSSAIRLLRADGRLGAIALGGRARDYGATGDFVAAGIGLVGRAFAEERPMWTDDIRTDDRFAPGPAIRERNAAVGIVAGLAVPLRVAGDVIGVLAVGSPSPRVFAEREIALLQAFADQAAIALSQAQRQEAVTKQAERLRLLHEIDRAIITETAPVAITEAVLWRLRDLLGVPRAIVTLFDWEAGEVEWLAAAGRHRMHVGPGVRYPLRFAGDPAALRRGEAQVIDAATLPPGPETDALRASGVLVYMVVPMIIGDQLIGSVSFGGEQGQFPDEQVDIAREVATQLAIAIVQARLLEQVKRHAVELESRAHPAARDRAPAGRAQAAPGPDAGRPGRRDRDPRPDRDRGPGGGRDHERATGLAGGRGQPAVQRGQVQPGAGRPHHGALIPRRRPGGGDGHRSRRRLRHAVPRSHLRLHRPEDYPGPGVGLAIVRKVAERHGGRAWAESVRGAGSTFFLAFPDPR